MDNDLLLHLLHTLLALDLKILQQQIWFTIIPFYGIWTSNYLDYEFRLRLLDFTGFGLGNTWTVI